MKEKHLKLLSTCKPEELLTHLRNFLLDKNEAERMTFEELCEFCSNNPPKKIDIHVINQIAVNYAQGANGFTPSLDNFLKLSRYSADQGDPIGMFYLGYYHFYLIKDHKKEKADVEKALNFFKTSWSKQPHKEFCLAIAEAHIAYGDLDEGVRFLNMVVVGDNKDQALIWLKAFEDNRNGSADTLCALVGRLYLKIDHEPTAFDPLIRVVTYKDETKQDKTKIEATFVTKLHAHFRLLPKVKIVDEKNSAALVPSFQNLHLNGIKANDAKQGAVLPNSAALPAGSAAINPNNSEDIELKKLREEFEKIKAQAQKIEAELQAKDIFVKGSALHGKVDVQDKVVADNKEAIEKLKKELANVKQAEQQANDKLVQKQIEIQRLGSKKELKRQYYVQRRFFNPQRTKNPAAYQVATRFLLGRLHKDSKDKTILTGKPARQIITAERATVETSLAVYPNVQATAGRNRFGWFDLKQECVIVGETEVYYKQNPSTWPNHLGNYYLTIEGGGNSSYGDIISIIDKITGSTYDKPKKRQEQDFAQLMLTYARTGNGVELQKLKAINPNADEKMLRQINQIFYHILIKENARWMASPQTRYDWPFAIMQGRAIKLVASGYLTMSEVFSPSAPYGVMTGVSLFNNYWDVESKMYRINRLYNQVFLLQPSFSASLTEPKVASHQELRTELLDVYGGENDTDDEKGYDSSDEDYQKLTL